MTTSTLSLDEYKQTLLDLLPDQGRWSEADYLWLTDHTNRLVEFTDGQIEVMPMPTDVHQTIVLFLCNALAAYAAPLGGKVQIAPLRLQVRAGKFREPDVLFLKSARDARRRNRFWTGADLVVEVVSEGKPERDLVDKRHDYAEGGVPEYWIVNPMTATITVLRLDNGSYAEQGCFGRGELATSGLLSGFAVAVSDVFDVDCPPDGPADEPDGNQERHP